MKNLPIIRVASAGRSCGCCPNANYEGPAVKKVDKIYEIVIGGMVSAICPDCLHSLVNAASEVLGLATSDCKSEKEDAGICPVCGGLIDPEDVGDDDGYGELRLHWECESCGAKGKAVHQTEHNFAYHEIESGTEENEEEEVE